MNASAIMLRQQRTTVSENWRSLTAVRGDGHRLVHVKTSHDNLAAEAAMLMGERSVRRDRLVAAVPFVSYDRDNNVLVTEHIEGDTLFNTLWNATQWWRRRSQLQPRDLVLRVAEWLADFHGRWERRGAPGVGTAQCQEWILDSLDRKIRSLRDGAFGRPIDARFAARLRTRAYALAEAPGWDALEIGPIHGDFVPTNMMVTGEGAAFVIDFADTRTGFHLEDVVRFWTAVWEMSQSGRHRATVFGPLLPQIFAVNHLPPGIETSAAFRLLRIWNAVTKLLQVRVLYSRVPRSTRKMVSRTGQLELQWLEGECQAGE